MSNSIRHIPDPVSRFSIKPKRLHGKADDFREVFQDIIHRKQESGKSGMAFLKTLDYYELTAIQKSKSLAEPLRMDKISAEGAENLFVLQGDNCSYVDLNNDGLTEIGEGKMFIFPPPNSSRKVKDAWATTCKDMTFEEKMLVEGRFLAEDLVKRINGDDRCLFGDSDSDLTALIDRIVEHAKRYASWLTPEQQEINDFVIRTLDSFKAELLK